MKRTFLKSAFLFKIGVVLHVALWCSWAQALPLELLNQPVVRVFMALDSPGLGHQSHTAELVERLLASGYKGRIEVVFFPTEGTSLEKVSRVLPTYDPLKHFSAKKFAKDHPEKDYSYDRDLFGQSQNEVLKDETHNIWFFKMQHPSVRLLKGRSFPLDDPGSSPKSKEVFLDENGEVLEDFELKPLPYVLTGGDDGFRFRAIHNESFIQDRLKSDALVTISPPGWLVPSNIRFSGFDMRELKDVPLNLSTQPTNWNWGAEHRDQALLSQLEFLIQEGVGVVPSYIDLLSSKEVLPRLKKALRSLEIDKTLVFPMFGVKQPKKSSKGIYEFSGVESFSRLKPGAINIVYLEKVSHPTFSHIFSKLNVPLVLVAGRNSVNLAARSGRPFVSTEPFRHYFDEELYPDEVSKHPYWKNFLVAQYALTRPGTHFSGVKSGVLNLRDLIQEAPNKDPRSHNFFKAFQAAVLRSSKKEDKIEKGLKEAFKVLAPSCSRFLN